MNKKLVSVRLEQPYELTLKKFKNQGTIVQQALDRHPNNDFQIELTKQKEVYDKLITEQVHRREEATS